MTLTLFPDPDSLETLERSFDLSKTPKVEEVTFGSVALGGAEGLSWILAALSTIRPATSPRLSVITLDFYASLSQEIETVIADLRDDLVRIANEISRIEREFDRVVHITVVTDRKFRMALDILYVRFSSLGGGNVVVMLIHPRSLLADLSAPHSLKWSDRHSHLRLVGHVTVSPLRFTGRVVWRPSCTLPLDRSAWDSHHGSASTKPRVRALPLLQLKLSRSFREPNRGVPALLSVGKEEFR